MWAALAVIVLWLAAIPAAPISTFPTKEDNTYGWFFWGNFPQKLQI